MYPQVIVFSLFKNQGVDSIGSGLLAYYGSLNIESQDDIKLCGPLTRIFEYFNGSPLHKYGA